MKYMKLLVDAHVFDGKYQGTRTYLQGIYSYMTKNKDIDFYFASKNIVNIQRIFGEAENIHYIQLKSSNKIFRLAFEFPKIIKKYKIDYAHFQYISPIIKCCKEIVTIHDIIFIDFPQYFPLSYRIKNSLLFRRAANRADILLTVSNYSKEAITEHFGINNEKIYITPNAVLSLENEQELPDIKKKYNIEKYILSVSRIEPRKNHQLLLRAYVELELYRQDIKLVLVGALDLKNKEFNDFYKKLGDEIKSNILIMQVPYQELVSLYKNALLFVFPSFAEGFGIPPIEAITFGCETLCSDQTAMKEFDFMGDNFFSPYSLEELKKKIILHLNKKNTENQLLRINEKYNWEKISDNFYNLLIGFDSNQKI